MRRPLSRVQQRYALLLVAILVSYVVAIMSKESQVGVAILILVQLSTLWFALRVSEADRLSRIAGIGILLVALALIASLIVGAAAGHLADMNKSWFVIVTAMYLAAPFVIARHLVLRRLTDVETLYGAISAYLMIGMSFAFLYRILGAWQPASFFGVNGDGLLSDDLFFSFCSLTTVGYGNLVPAGNPGQTLAVLEALLGQLFLVIVVARVVTNLRGPRAATNEDAPADAVSGAASDTIEST